MIGFHRIVIGFYQIPIIVHQILIRINRILIGYSRIIIGFCETPDPMGLQNNPTNENPQYMVEIYDNLSNSAEIPHKLCKSCNRLEIDNNLGKLLKMNGHIRILAIFKQNVWKIKRIIKYWWKWQTINEKHKQKLETSMEHND